MLWFVCFFCFNETATTEIYTYVHTHSLHDALSISSTSRRHFIVARMSAKVSSTPAHQGCVGWLHRTTACAGAARRRKRAANGTKSISSPIGKARRVALSRHTISATARSASPAMRSTETALPNFRVLWHIHRGATAGERTSHDYP